MVPSLGDRDELGRPKPRFQTGDWVRTVVGHFGDRTVKTALIATVRSSNWHAKRRSWIYSLAVRRRKRRWYLETELAPAGDVGIERS